MNSKCENLVPIGVVFLNNDSPILLKNNNVVFRAKGRAVGPVLLPEAFLSSSIGTFHSFAGGKINQSFISTLCLNLVIYEQIQISEH